MALLKAVRDMVFYIVVGIAVFATGIQVAVLFPYSGFLFVVAVVLTFALLTLGLTLFYYEEGKED
jgi:hypothetical protein